MSILLSAVVCAVANALALAVSKSGLPFYGGIAEGVHLFPFRTEKLSPSWPMVLDLVPGE